MSSSHFEPLVRVMIAATILIATTLLGIGDRTAVLTLISMCVLALSAYVTDTTGRFRLTQSMANWLALGVVAAASLDATRLDRHGQMVAVANLQSYLQFVLLFQPKTSRVYWQLAMLSLGQVAIASTLVPGPMFGGMLLLYLIAGTATFLLLLLDSESARFGARPEAMMTSGPGVTPLMPVPARRGPILTGRSLPNPRGMGLGLCQQAALICLSSLVVTSSLFFFLPRWNVQNRQVTTNEQIRSVGFSKKVTLGELGEVVHNADLVMRIQFLRSHSGKPFKLLNEPLLRGVAVTHYENGAWTQSTMRVLEPLSSELRSPFVRQHIWAEPLDVGELFCVHPVFALPGGDYSRLKIDGGGDELVRLEDIRSEQVEFEVGTIGISEGRQRQFVPCEPVVRRRVRAALLQMPTVGDGRSDPFEGLREIASRVLREANIDRGNHLAAARKLNDYLHSSGRYFYSLEAQNRNPALDPLEDFVTTNRSGHCEYFAGALVMMLRSQGIPARMAIGFKGGEWNSLGNYYQVQQLHAHTWVEAYLDKENLPREDLVVDETPVQAAWMLLDPTEGTQENSQSGQQVTLMARLRQTIDYGHILWTNYVVGLNAKRQRQGIYEPLTAGLTAAVENLVSPQVWQARIRALSRSPLGTFWEWYSEHWMSWWGGLVAAGFSLVLAALYAAVRWLAAVIARGRFGRGRFGDAPPVLEMYRRLEAALGYQGLKRQPGQTAYEFAIVAGGELAEKIELRRLAHLPRRVVEAFYRVRFGGRTLDNLEANAVEHALTELEHALVQPR